VASIGDACDRHPSALAHTAWYNPATRGLVVLCGHCAAKHELPLTLQGFELTLDNRASLVHDRLMGAL